MDSLIKKVGIGVFLITISLIAYNLHKSHIENKKSNEEISVQIISHGVKQLSKLLVAEQTYSELFSHKNTNSQFFDWLKFEKNLVLFVEIKHQATYDYSKLNIEIDSLNQKLIINEIPTVEIASFPQVKFHNLNQSNFNKYEKNELNTIRNLAIEKLENKIDLKPLKIKARKQLFDGLSELFLLAKIYNWEIVNLTDELVKKEQIE